MKVAVTGFYGGLVHDKLVKMGCTPVNADIMLQSDLADILDYMHPNVVIHTAAMTDVDKCERDTHRAFLVNVRGSTLLAEVCQKLNIHLIYLSTCHIFDGKAKRPYKEQDNPKPLNVYGWTKWMGEMSVIDFAERVTTIRISKIFNKQSFSVTDRKEPIVRPAFIVRSYIHLDHICNAILQVAQDPTLYPHILNISSTNSMSDYALWSEFYRKQDRSDMVFPKLADEPEFTPRPHNGALDVSLATFRGIALPTVEDGLALCYE